MRVAIPFDVVVEIDFQQERREFHVKAHVYDLGSPGVRYHHGGGGWPPDPPEWSIDEVLEDLGVNVLGHAWRRWCDPGLVDLLAEHADVADAAFGAIVKWYDNERGAVMEDDDDGR